MKSQRNMQIGTGLLASALVLAACGQPPDDYGSLSAELASRERKSVLTSRNDNARRGAYLEETTLKPSNVRPGQFGLLASIPVDGKIYAQPLYAHKLRMAGAGDDDDDDRFFFRDHHSTRKNVVFIATEHNTVYALDSDNLTAAPLWSRTLGPTVPQLDLNIPGRNCRGIVPEVGISGTPHIDLDRKIMYVVAKIKENDQYFNRLFALDITSGADRIAPVDVAGSVPGTGTDSVGGVLTFNAKRHNQRAGLLLDKGVLYVPFGAHCDIPPWQGWIFAYDARTFALKDIYVPTANGEAGGIWQNGAGMSADGKGNIFFVAGNGTYGPGRVMSGIGQAPGRLRWVDGKLTLQDYFIPFNQQAQNDEDADMAFAVMLPPKSDFAITLMRGHNMPSQMYVLRKDNFGGFHASQADETTQTVLVSDPDLTADPTNTKVQRAYSLVYWEPRNRKPRIYAWAQNDFPRAYELTSAGVTPTPVATGTSLVTSTTVTGMLSVSANDERDGVLWGSVNVDTTDNNTANAVLYAVDAVTMQELWHSRMDRARDEVGLWPKFAQPVVANGKVYMANASGQLKVYGLLPPAVE